MRQVTLPRCFFFSVTNSPDILLYDGVKQSRILGGQRQLDPYFYSIQTYGSNTIHSLWKNKKIK